jgi:hypothetical protein
VYDDGDDDVLDAIAAMAQDGDGDVEDRPERVYWWERRALRFPERQWRREFRVSKMVFNFVLDKIVSHDVFRVARNITRPIPVEKQLAIFLYRVGRPYPGVASVADKFEVSSSTVVAITSRVARAIRARLGHMVHMPKSGALKKEMKKGFTDRGYEGGVVVIDGTGVCIVPPTKMVRAGQRHVFVGKSSSAQKRYQIACDASMRIGEVVEDDEEDLLLVRDLAGVGDGAARGRAERRAGCLEAFRAGARGALQRRRADALDLLDLEGEVEEGELLRQVPGGALLLLAALLLGRPLGHSPGGARGGRGGGEG